MSESGDLRWVVIISSLLITALSPVLTAVGDRLYRKQLLFEYPDGYLPRRQSGIRGLLLPLLGTVAFLSIALFLVPSYFEFFGGGLLVSQLVGISTSAGNLFLVKKLVDVDSGSGHVVYSTSTRYVQFAANLFSGSFLCIALYLLIRRTMLAGGAFYLFFTSLGYFRRARQARSSAAQQGAARNASRR